ATTSAPLTDNGFRYRLTLDSDRLIVGIVVVKIQGGIGKRGDKADLQQVLIEFRLGHSLLRRSGLAAYGGLAGRRNRWLPRPGALAIEPLAKLPHLPRRQRFDAAQELVEVAV